MPPRPPLHTRLFESAKRNVLPLVLGAALGGGGLAVVGPEPALPECPPVAVEAPPAPPASEAVIEPPAAPVVVEVAPQEPAPEASPSVSTTGHPCDDQTPVLCPDAWNMKGTGRKMAIVTCLGEHKDVLTPACLASLTARDEANAAVRASCRAEIAQLCTAAGIEPTLGSEACYGALKAQPEKLSPGCKKTTDEHERLRLEAIAWGDARGAR